MELMAKSFNLTFAGRDDNTGLGRTVWYFVGVSLINWLWQLWVMVAQVVAPEA